MTKITLVEVWAPNHNPGPNNSRVECDLAFIASSRGKAEQFVSEHPDYCRGLARWCWCLYETEIDDPRHEIFDKTFIGTDGRTHSTLQAAWDACGAAASHAAS